MAKLAGNSDFDKLASLAQRTYKEQAIWFLNSFWHKNADQAELLWKYVLKCGEYDLQGGSNGNELDELNSHRFLEFFSETMTVREMRDSLRSTGAIGDRVKMFPLIHYLIYKYKVSWNELVNASQGDNKEEIEQAQALLASVQAAFKESEARATEAAAAVKEAFAREQEAKLRVEEAKAAQAELEAALAELKAQEDAYNSKKSDLERRSEEGGVVSRNKAKAELSQLLAEDPLPLRRAKITQEAAVNKANRATVAANDARIASEKARKQSEEAAAAAEAALDDAAAKVDEAQAFLEEVKSKPGQAQGAIWWIERELFEQKKYLPASRGGIAK